MKLQFELKAFKNRHGMLLTREALAHKWTSNMHWEEANGVLVPAHPCVQHKYPEHHAFALCSPDTTKLFEYMPSKALIVFRVGNNELIQHYMHYRTVSVHGPAPQYSGMVLCSLNQPRPSIDTCALPNTIWKQLHSPDQGIVLLIKLIKIDSFDATVAKDDVTGEAYPYRIKVIRVLFNKRVYGSFK